MDDEDMRTNRRTFATKGAREERAEKKKMNMSDFWCTFAEKLLVTT